MFTKDFDFDLPERLIAQKPSDKRGEDRLLVLNKETGAISDHDFKELPLLLPKNALLVFNNSKVRHARIYGKKDTGATIEILLIHSLKDSNGTIWKAMVKRAKRQKVGMSFSFEDATIAEIIEADFELEPGFKLLKFDKPIDDAWLDKYGHVPLPPYIHREDCDEDAKRYQTVYAKIYGSIAAPTAGLHFTDEVLANIRKQGIQIEYVTLHVGLGTFLPVRSELVEEHKMHTEEFCISEETARNIEQAKKEGRPVIAVGTTSVRSLESAWNEETQSLKTGFQSTNIFIYPSYKFKVVDKLFTNFHTPESSLVMLVSALAGKENIFKAYKHAVEKEYRFFSYGDAMLID